MKKKKIGPMLTSNYIRLLTVLFSMVDAIFQQNKMKKKKLWYVIYCEHIQKILSQ